MHRALINLALTNPTWNHNLFAFGAMADTTRATWWLRAQAQAERGVPSMQALVNEFIAVRLTS